MYSTSHFKPLASRGGKRSSAFTLVELLVVIAIIGILVALLLPAIQAAREAARRMSCTNNAKNIALALHNYHDAQGAFPFGMVTSPEGRQPVSNVRGGNVLWKNWVVMILPYLEAQTTYDMINFNVPLSDPNDQANRTVRSTNLNVMRCPSDPNVDTLCDRSNGDWARGNYAINGQLTSPSTDIWDRREQLRGIASVDRSVSMRQIADGTSNTLMIGELRVGLSPSDRRGTWAMGMCGSSVLCMHATNAISGPNSCSPTADDLADARVVVRDVGDATLRQECMLPFQGAGSQQAACRSSHVGGVVVAMADASVHFISDFIQGTPYDIMKSPPISENNFGIWQRLNGSSDGFLLDRDGF